MSTPPVCGGGRIRPPQLPPCSRGWRRAAAGARGAGSSGSTAAGWRAAPGCPRPSPRRRTRRWGWRRGPCGAGCGSLWGSRPRSQRDRRRRHHTPLPPSPRCSLAYLHHYIYPTQLHNHHHPMHHHTTPPSMAPTIPSPISTATSTVTTTNTAATTTLFGSSETKQSSLCPITGNKRKNCPSNYL